MIGSLMFYVLYPLTWLLNRVSDAVRKPPSVCTNGKEVWDGGGGVPSRRFTRTQNTARLDQRLSEGKEEARRETRDGLEEGAPGGESGTGGVCKVMKEEEEEKVEELTLVDPNKSSPVAQVQLSTETAELQDPSGNRTEDSASEETGRTTVISPLGGQTETLAMGESAPTQTQALKALVLENVGTQADDCAVAAEECWDQPIDLGELHAGICGPPPPLEPTQTQALKALVLENVGTQADDCAVAAEEIWDQPIDLGELHAGICGPPPPLEPLDLVTLLAESETHGSQAVEGHSQFWDEAHYPPWQYPGMSYYPPLQERVHPYEDAVRKPPSVCTNGKEVWDGGGGVPSRRFTRTQNTARLDQRLSEGKEEARRETRDGLEEGAPGGESGTGGVCKVMKEEEEEKVEELTLVDPNKSSPVAQVQLSTETAELQDPSGNRTEDSASEETGRTTVISPLGGQTETLAMGESAPTQTQALKALVLENVGTQADDCAVAAEEGWDQPIDLGELHAGICGPPPPLEPTQTQALKALVLENVGTQADNCAVAAEEIWDQPIDLGELHAGICGPPPPLEPLDLVTLLAESETHGSQAVEGHSQFWDEAHYPPWQYPGMSYYPPLQERVHPYEEMWRMWEDLGESHAAAEPPQGARQDLPQACFDFTVMSYNILAQGLLEANQELYKHCPLEVLGWNYRLHVLMKELQRWEPDILCLQEVQENHYYKDLHPALCAMGYTCVYKQRTGVKADGCAVCYQGDRFSELSVARLVEFYRPGGSELLDRDNVAVILLLQPLVAQGGGGSGVTTKAKAPPLCVANTHLLFNPKRGDVKLAQLAVLLAEVDRVAGSCRAGGGGGEGRCNVVLCGDFNAVPNMLLYQLITTGLLHYHGLPAWMVSGQEDLSYKPWLRSLSYPLWPSSLGITDSCQYTAGFGRENQESAGSGKQSQESGAALELISGVTDNTPGKLQYEHDFLLQLRYCDDACVRPQDLEVIPGVTDNTPDPKETYHWTPRPSPLCHDLSLLSTYSHVIPGTGYNEVTTLHIEGGATVDYIFYSGGRGSSTDHKGGAALQGGGLKLLGRLSLLSEEDLWSMKGLPNEVFPSDHLSLLAKFQLDLRPL